MPTRRSFLTGSLVVLAMPTAGMRPAGAATPAPLHMIVDSTCADARAFAAGGAEYTAIGADPTAVLAAFNRACDIDDASAWFGLTRDSHQFIFEQVALPRGYRVVYRGTHDYRDGHLRHTLRAEQASLALAHADHLRLAGAAWPTALARSVPILADSAGCDHVAHVTTTVTILADSPAYLVSWCLRRV